MFAIGTVVELKETKISPWNSHYLTNSRNSSDNLSEFQFIQNGGFSSCIQTNYNKTNTN